MLTKKDLQLLENYFERRFANFVTKDEFEVFRREIKSDLLQFKDDILFEIKAMRENFSGYEYRQREHSDQLENHEKRLYSVEKKVLH